MADKDVEKGLDSELIQLLDFDYDLPCDVERFGGCDSPAEWKVILSCCGAIVLFCDVHFNAILEKIDGIEEFYDDTPGGCLERMTEPIAFAERLDKSQ